MAHAVVHQLPAARLASLRAHPALLLRTHLPSSCCVCSSAHTEPPVLHSNERLQQGAQPVAQEQQQQQSAAAVADEDDWLQRSRLLVGADGLAKLSALNLLLVGLGGVGSFAAEFLCRAGVGSMTLVDGDTVDTTNRNRQLPALASTVGQLKTEVVATRLNDINPHLRLTVHQEFLDPVRAAALVQEQQYSYVIDCIDSVAPKQALLLAGHAAGVPTISSMGAGGRLDPSRVRLADIADTHNDAFAAVVRKRLRKAGVSSGITVVFSDEPAQPASLALTEQQYKRSYFGTSSYIPALFGLYIASHVIRQTVEPGYQGPPRPKTTSSSKTTKLGRRSRSSGSSKSSSSSSSSSGRRAGSEATGSIDTVGSTGSGTAADPGASPGDSDASAAQGGSAASAADPASAQPTAASRQQQHLIGTPDQQAATAPSLPQHTRLFSSYEQAQGLGMGMDGEGL